jgi:hypothetical protein
MYSAARAAPREEKMKQRELDCLEKAIYPTPARKRNFKRFACYATIKAGTQITNESVYDL